jgi:transcription elongation factor Elf1
MIVEQAINEGQTAMDVYQACFDAVAKRQAPPQTFDALEAQTGEL